MRPLSSLPISSHLIKNLNELGFKFCEELWDKHFCLNKKVKSVLEQGGSSEVELRELLQIPQVVTAEQLLLKEIEIESITTFSEALDNILNDGFYLGSFWQICGTPGSGKTLLLMQLCINVQIPKCIGGLDGEAIFVDTESSFTFSRIQELAKSAFDHCSNILSMHNLQEEAGDFSEDKMLERIHYIPINGCTDFLAVVELIKEFLSVHHKVKLIAVDSLTLPFLELNSTIDRTRLVNNLLSDLHSLAEYYNVAVLVVNHLTTRLKGPSKTLVPSLGETVSHRVPQTLLLTAVKQRNLHTAVVLKSSNHSQLSVDFSISSNGIRDLPR